ncbi:hypothetical protein PanWU01x14_252850 [Parasponia andersonii]|uniref:Uncharacterized protein n=1 Tax=Parasponia andersonii TaxID=3476 RepID=A0A2P5BBW2_PARAD|nr:hypothetical protein PanWU01x14_252850 [Parasponia andersonii]
MVSGRPENHDSDHTAQSKVRDDEDVNWIFELSRFTFEDFEKLIDKFMRFYKNTTMELKSSDLGLKIVTVEGYKIPHTLAPVLGTLLDKYGDVSSKSTETSTKEWKSVAYFILRQVLKGMYSSKVADITINLLQEWFYHLTFVKYFVGFKTDFAAEHLVKVVVHAFLGLQAKRLENEIPNMINLQIERLQQDIMKAKSKLEKCKELCGSSPKSEYMKDCLNMASKLKWENACEASFFLDSDSSSTTTIIDNHRHHLYHYFGSRASLSNGSTKSLPKLAFSIARTAISGQVGK